MALLLLHMRWVVYSAKANVPFMCECVVILKFFARWLSPGREHGVFLSRMICQWCRVSFCHYALNCHVIRGLPITARQYGEVVLPDAASGQGPDTLARKLSRCKEGMAQFLQIPAKDKVVQRLDLSRAVITSLIDDRKLNCHDKTV